MKLGKLPPRPRRKLLMLSSYTAALEPAPAAVDYSKALTSLGTMRNDQLGDCTCAAVGHVIQTWTANAGTQVIIPDDEIVELYEQACGYDPSKPATDNGGVEADVLNFWRKNPQFVGGHELAAYAAVEPGNHADVMDAVWMLGAAYIGLALPSSAQDQDVWSVPIGGAVGPAAPDSWGGHAVPVVAYDSRGLTCITWGALKRMTWQFWDAYCVAPETKVLKANLQWVSAGSLKESDDLLGFDEFAPFAGGHRRWRKSTVHSAPLIERPCYRLTFEDGTEIVCSEEHKWLVSRGGNLHWVETCNLRFDRTMPSRVVKPVTTWSEEISWEAGYLAAAFDGEGHLTQSDLTDSESRDFGVASVVLGFSQKPNAMLRQVESCLDKLGFDFSRHEIQADAVQRLTLKRRAGILRFLGSIRPRRLLDRFNIDLLGAMTNHSGSAVAVRSKEFIGSREVVALKTSTGTFLAEGFASHNCDEAYALVGPEWISSKGTAPSGFAMDALMKDLAAL